MNCKLLHQESKNKISLFTKGGNVVHQYATKLIERGEQNSTLAKKLPADGVQCGRSMIEMLGVLAIIGVLSVGGIAGFSKMLARQKIMQTQEQIDAIAAKLSAAGSEISSYNGLNNKTAIKFQAIPSEAIVDAAEGKLQNPYGGEILIVPCAEDSAYAVVYNKIPKDACVSLATLSWGGKNSSFQRIFILRPSATNPLTEETLLYVAANNMSTKEKIEESYKNYTYKDVDDKPLSPTEATVPCQCEHQDCATGLVFH